MAAENESPADEYEDRLVERQVRAWRWVRRLARVSFAGQGVAALAVAAVCAGGPWPMFAHGPPPDPLKEAAFTVIAIAFCAGLVLSALTAAVAGVWTLAAIRVLRPVQAAFGLAPWGLVAAEFVIAILGLGV